MKTITIQLKGEIGTRIVWLNGVELFPADSQKVKNHSPDGFCWGYCGSGPAQLALAVLLKITDKQTALANYQQFKTEVIASLLDDFDVELDVTKFIISESERKCRVCGCTDDNACPDDGSGQPCHWVEQNLCSACEGKK